MKAGTRIITMAAILAAVLGVFGVGFAAAAESTGSSPYDALSPAGDSMSLDAGQSHWYAFQYAGGQSQIRVQLWGNNAAFSVWTQSQVDAWARGDDVEPIGRGADETYVDGDLSWAGSFNIAGTYYVKVEQTGGAISNYVLEVSGSEVSYPMTSKTTETSEATETTDTTDTTTSAAETPESAPAEVTQTTDGSGPADALTIDGAVRTLDAGESHWYIFKSYGADSQITLEMSVYPSVGTTFSVWTPDQIRAWALGQEVEPVGRGTTSDPTVSGPAWSGSFNVAGDYYVRVENNSAGISQYSLTIQ